MRVAVFAFASALLGTCSCAAIFQGTTEPITVTSDPPGATATLSNGETRVTPFTITVPRQQDLDFHFSKPGYQSTDVVDDAQIEGGYVAADLFTFLIGTAIDSATGAYFAHQESMVTAHLDSEVTVAPATSNQPEGAPPQVKPSKSAASDNRR
ncbi:MAG: hypothetical protein IVW54_12595 [Candidatus Binataceae bacterium]|nr:hypothetical protein [Candidatus Binataceae bacterium]